MTTDEVGSAENGNVLSAVGAVPWPHSLPKVFRLTTPVGMKREERGAWTNNAGR